MAQMAPLQKRRAPVFVEDEEDDDPSQDVGFQTDTRRLPAVNRIPVMSARSHSAEVRALPRTSAQYIAQELEPEPSPKRMRMSSTQRKNPGQAREPLAFDNPFADEAPELTAAQEYRRATQMAKMKRPFTAAKQRTPWSEEEEGALIDYIADYGPSYALIKTQDNIGNQALSNRTAEDVRHKARNMKTNFLL